MPAHKFKVGQMLDFSARRMGVPSPIRSCTILRLLPAEDGQLQYRIRCAAENFERVAKESALSPRA